MRNDTCSYWWNYIVLQALAMWWSTYHKTLPRCSVTGANTWSVQLERSLTSMVHCHSSLGLWIILAHTRCLNMSRSLHPWHFFMPYSVIWPSTLQLIALTFSCCLYTVKFLWKVSFHWWILYLLFLQIHKYIIRTYDANIMAQCVILAIFICVISWEGNLISY